MTETKSKIMTWIGEDGFSIKDITTEKDEFRIQMDRTGQSYVVVQQKGQKYMLFYANLLFDKKSLTELSKKGIDELKEYFLNLRLELARFSTGFQIFWEDPKKFLIKRVHFTSSRLFIEDLTRTLFFQLIDDLRHCQLYTIWFFQKAIGKFEENQTEPDKTYI